jgi:hypothetical protein
MENLDKKMVVVLVLLSTLITMSVPALLGWTYTDLMFLKRMFHSERY